MTDQLPAVYAIQYSEFDIIKGAYIYYETAKTNFSEEKRFSWIRNFVCPEPNLKDKMIVLTIEDQKLIGCPVIIYDGQKYKDNRNEFRFNACFIVPVQADSLKYEVAVRKLAKYLRTLEDDSCFLTTQTLKDQYLKPGLDEIVNKLNENGQQCSVKMYSSVFVNLKLLEQRGEPSPVSSSDVPIFCNNIDLNNMVEMDPMTQRIIGSIDGLRHVHRIAHDTDTERALVEAAVQNLAYHNVVKLIPIFSYKNRYIVTPKIQELYKDISLQKELVFFVVRNGVKDCVLFYDCFRMICAFDHGSLVKDVISKMKVNNIDEKKLVQYCVLKGYLRRVRDYPISRDNSLFINESTSEKLEEALKTKSKPAYHDLCDGTNDSDSLACSGHTINTRPQPNARRYTQQSQAASNNYITLWK